jgi:hypothetical protein
MQHVIYSVSVAQNHCVKFNGFATYVNQLHESNNDKVDEGNIA